MNTAGWPWLTGTRMECTTCHNVHQQTAASGGGSTYTLRNFLRAPAYEGAASAAPTGMFCDKCHPNRLSDASSNALGTHPVGTLVAPGDSARGGVHSTHVAGNIVYPISAGNIVPLYDPTGSHTTDGGATGGVACWTCHQPHGADEKLIYQPRYDATNAYSAICESCHGTRPNLNEAVKTLIVHPVDAGSGDDIVVRNGVNVAITVNRPFSANLGVTGGYASLLARAGTAGEVVCLSCHGVHETAPNTQIFRQEIASPGTGICDDCHRTVMTGSSHPVGVTMTNEHGGVWPNRDALPLTGANIVCSTCHAGHSGAAGARFMLRTTDANSEICVNCHTTIRVVPNAGAYGTLGTPAPYAETNPVGPVVSNSANPSQYMREALYSGADYTAAVGTRLGTHASYRNVRNAGGHQAWKVTLTGPAQTTGAITSFYGAGNVIICQSCHAPHGASVAGGWHGTAGSKDILLQQNGTDGARTGVDGGGNVGGAGQTGYDQTKDTICQACHVPTGTHAVQSWIVSRTGVALNPASAFVTAVGGVPTAPADYFAAAGPMTCESCHSPHAAATTGGSFILEAAGASAQATTGGERPEDRNRDPLCALCHAY
jgi:predicted CXXCH cytochrome family protein